MTNRTNAKYWRQQIKLCTCKDVYIKIQEWSGKDCTVHYWKSLCNLKALYTCCVGYFAQTQSSHSHINLAYGYGYLFSEFWHRQTLFLQLVSTWVEYLSTQQYCNNTATSAPRRSLRNCHILVCCFFLMVFPVFSGCCKIPLCIISDSLSFCANISLKWQQQPTQS